MPGTESQHSLWSDLPYLISMIVWCSAVVAALVLGEGWVDGLLTWFLLVSVSAFALLERGAFRSWTSGRETFEPAAQPGAAADRLAVGQNDVRYAEVSHDVHAPARQGFAGR